MKEDSMLMCLIAFVLGYLVARMMRGNGLSVGGEEIKCIINNNNVKKLCKKNNLSNEECGDIYDSIKKHCNNNNSDCMVSYQKILIGNNTDEYVCTPNKS